MSITLYPILNYMKPRILPWYLILPFIFYCHVAIATPNKDIRQLRQLYLQIESEIKKGTYHRFEKNKTLLKDYPLYPYLEYQYFKKNISKVTGRELELFTKNYPTFPHHLHLRHLWLKNRAERGRFTEFLTHYQDSSDIELQCHYIQAHLKFHHNADILDKVKPIWLYGHSRPKACDIVFELWESQ